MAQRPVPFILLPLETFRNLNDPDKKAYIEALRHHLDATTAEAANSSAHEPRPLAKPSV